MKDVTVTSFGLVIAYLLPGVTALYSLGFWFPGIHPLFQIFLTTQSNVGLFVIVVLVSLAVGLIVHGMRAVLYEYIFCKKETRFDHSHFRKLTSVGRAEAFRSLVDEMYRYHQWWGGLSIIWPFFVYGFFSEQKVGLAEHLTLWTAAGTLEIIFVYIATRVRSEYFGRFKMMLEGELDIAAAAVVPSPSGPPATDAESHPSGSVDPARP